MNNRGVTLLYVLMALLAVSFIGMNLIGLSGSDAKAGVYYGVTEKARANTINASYHALHIIEVDENEPEFDSLMVYLSDYMNAESDTELIDRYILGDSITYVSMPGDPRSKYRAKLIAFDPTTMMVQIKIDGISQGNSKSTNIGLYYLDGLEVKIDTVYDTVPDTTFTPMAAFRLGGDTDFESNVDIEVTGMVYLSGKLTLNSGTFIFNDYVYQEDGAYTNKFGGNVTFKKGAYLGAINNVIEKPMITNGDISFSGDVDHVQGGVFNGDTYIGGHIHYSSNIVTYNGRLGWEKSVVIDGIPNIGGDVWFGGGWASPHWSHANMFINGWNNTINMNGFNTHSAKGTFKNAGDPPPEYLDLVCTNVGMNYRRTTPFDVDSALHIDIPFDPTKYPELSIDTSVLNSVTHQFTNGKVTGNDINSMWFTAAANGDTLCGGFMVLEVTQGAVTDNNVALIEGTSLIDCKVVIINKGTHNLNKFPGTTTDANVVLWAYSTNSTVQFGGPNFSYMRGILFMDGKGYQMQPGDLHIVGATYITKTAAHYNNSGSSFHYEYDSTVLEETACLGVISDPNDSTVNDITDVVSIDRVLTLKTNYTHIVTKLVSRTY